MRWCKSIFLIFLGLCCIGFTANADAIDESQHPSDGSSPSLITVPEDTFQELFNDYIYEMTEKDPADVIISKFSVTRNQPVPDGDIRFRLFQKNKSALKGYVKLIAIVSVDGVAESEVRLSAWVDIFAPVVCASRHLKRGEIIQSGDVYMGRANIARQPKNILTSTEKAIGFLVRNSIKQGMVLKEWMVEKKPILDKGDMVTILAKGDRIRITVPGKILEKGYAGEIIKVENTMSNKEIEARVKDNSTVIVEF